MLEPEEEKKILFEDEEFLPVKNLPELSKALFSLLEQQEHAKFNTEYSKATRRKPPIYVRYLTSQILNSKGENLF